MQSDRGDKTMKAWGDDDPRPRPSPILRSISTIGDGYMSTNERVLLPSLALNGESRVEFVVLVDPRTGDRYGEESSWPGAALVPLAGHRLMRSSPEAVAALERLAADIRKVRRALGDRHAARQARWAAREARREVARCARPFAGELAYDAGDAIRGDNPEAASWVRTNDGASLHIPDRWAGEWEGSRTWSTDLALVVAATPSSFRALSELAGRVRARTSATSERVGRLVRQIGERRLSELEPVLEGSWLGS
jgi:hypothetical protein